MYKQNELSDHVLQYRYVTEQETVLQETVNRVRQDQYSSSRLR